MRRRRRREDMWKYLKKYLWLVMLGPVFMAGEVMIDLIQPKMMSTIVDEGVLGISNNGIGNLDLIISTGGRMLGIIVIGGCCGILSGICTNVASMRFSNELRKDVFKKIMELSFEQTERFSTGSLITRITNDITQLQNLIGQMVRGVVRNLVFMAGGIFFIMSLDMSFGAVVACAMPFIVIGTGYFIFKINPLFSVLQEKLDRVNVIMQENVTGARVVKAYVREDYEEDRFRRANDELVGTQRRILELVSFMSPIMNIALNLSVVAVIKIGAVHVQNGTVTPGNVMAAITYLSQILSSVMVFANISQQVFRGLASKKRIWEVLACEPVIRDGDGAAGNREKEENEGGSIEFKHVSFSYPQGNGERVLNDISFSIEPGETIGVMGVTGCGKSTLVSLIPRFYDVSEGEVLIDGVNVKDYVLEDLRNKVAVSLQKSELFGMSIRENLSWGSETAGEKEMKAAARAAQAEEFILQKEGGYDNQVAEKGMSLSGGQKQRLSIARALLKKSRILILDDSTSALDLKTEAALYKELQSNYGRITKIIIAQRISSVKDADRILLLENGCLAAFASHEELLERCELYQDIYHSQLGENAEEMGGVAV